MGQKEIDALIALAKQDAKKEISREQALENLINAGILNKHEKFTAPYQNLETVFVKK